MWFACLLAILLGGAFVATPAVSAATTTPTITLTPNVGPPTSTVMVTGAGFGATESVTIDFDAVMKATVTTTSLGSFSASFVVPASALPGLHPVKASGQTSGSLVTANFRVRTDWSTFHFNSAATGYNPYENVLGAGNVASLKQFGTGAMNPRDVLGSSPVIAGGVVYMTGFYYGLYAFSASCLNAAQACAPLWTAPAQGADLLVSAGVVYVAAGGRMAAYDAAGRSAFCSGTPKTCKPMWTANIPWNGTGAAAPAVSGGIVYFPGGSGRATLYAFSTAAPAANCTTSTAGAKTCTPLWSAKVGASIVQGVTVANHVIYVNAGIMYAFSDNYPSSTYCTGTAPNRVCTPAWISTSGEANGEPVIADGRVYTDSGNGILSAFDAAASTATCSGTVTTKTCHPIWSTGVGWSYVTPTVANGIVYTSDEFRALEALNATTGAVAWRSTANALSPYTTPVVAQGVVYVGDTNGHLRTYATTANASCTGATPTCPPLWVVAQSSVVNTPIVTDGVVYGLGSRQLSAYHR